MNSERSREGYLFIDHRFSPGVPDEIMVAHGLPANAGRGVFEGPTYQCGHCNGTVFMKVDRTRPRDYCRKCDRHCCDACGAIRAASGGECRNFSKLVDDVQELALRGLPTEGALVLTR
jgi:hypothetical protein